MNNNKIIHLKKPTQCGITLIEALVALLILALGVLGLAAVQVRMLVETRTTNSRATAIRLIADLGERIRMNVVGAQPQTGGNSPYSDSICPPGTAGSFPPPPAAPICDPAATVNGNACTTPQQQAQFDVWAWRREVADSLMNGLASICQVSPRQLQVVVAWQLNENYNITLSGTPADQQLSAPLQITSAIDQSTNMCIDSTHICHIDFIDIPAQ
jgi:type IV pilus assembly protein PilV